MTSATYISNRIYSTLLTALLIIFGTAGSILAAEDSDTVEVSLITSTNLKDTRRSAYAKATATGR